MLRLNCGEGRRKQRQSFTQDFLYFSVLFIQYDCEDYLNILYMYQRGTNILKLTAVIFCIALI